MGTIRTWAAHIGLLLVALGGGCASAPEPGEFGYVALGASDAVGIGAIPLRRGYVFRIRDGLEADGRDVELSNLGIPGAQVDDIARIARLAPAAAPDLITLWTGANDLIDGDDPDDFADSLRGLLERLRDDTDALIVIADLPDLSRLPRFVERPSPAVTPQRVQAFNQAITEQADDFDVMIVRLSAIDMPEQLASDIDGFHPDNEGHRILAERFLAVIRAQLGPRR